MAKPVFRVIRETRETQVNTPESLLTIAKGQTVTVSCKDFSPYSTVKSASTLPAACSERTRGSSAMAAGRNWLQGGRPSTEKGKRSPMLPSPVIGLNLPKTDERLRAFSSRISTMAPTETTIVKTHLPQQAGAAARPRLRPAPPAPAGRQEGRRELRRAPAALSGCGYFEEGRRQTGSCRPAATVPH